MAANEQFDRANADSKDAVDLNHPPTFINPCDRKAYDRSVTLEEYMHYAKLTREEEKLDQPMDDKAVGFLQQVFRRKSVTAETAISGTQSPPSGDEKQRSPSDVAAGRAHISPSEWRDASRLMRTASCKSVRTRMCFNDTR